jgi:ribose transport system substrate-binding protein
MLSKKRVIIGLALVLLFSVVAYGAGTTEKKGHWVIGWSNSYNGNSYRQVEEAMFKDLADKMKQEGIIADFNMVCSNNNVSQQISQIENMILKKVDAIIIDPGSPTALNGVIAKAKAAGIPTIIVNDGPVTSKDCYQLNFRLSDVTRIEAEYVVEHLKGKGNVLVIRGTAGNQSEADLYKGHMDVFKKYPGIKIVGTVYGNWTHSVALSAIAGILPSLPKVDAVVGQGGDEYAAIMAFQAAGKPVPLVTGGNRGNFLHWWAEEAKKNGYETISVASNPWGGAAGLYIIVDILNGVKVPREMIMPNFVVTQDLVSKFADLDPNAVACPTYDHDWVIKNLEKQKAH